MPISPLGGINFANQNAPVHSAQLSNELAKDSFATLVNMSEFQAKEKAIEKQQKVKERKSKKIKESEQLTGQISIFDEF